MDVLLAETAERIFVDHRADPPALWQALEENGLTRVWVSEEQGGFGLSPVDGFGLIRLAGYHAASVPLPETLVASWLLSAAGLEVPDGKLSFAITDHQASLPFGQEVQHVVHIDGREVAVERGVGSGSVIGVGLDPASPITTRPARAITQRGTMPFAIAPRLAALTRAAQICGALDAALDLTTTFAMQREQFGRSLSKFQAIQHLLADMAIEAAAASAAVDAAVASTSRDADLDLLTIGAAKCRAGQAAGIVADNAHQVHGAIGYTEEYELARLTRRLWQWRDDFGGEAWWADQLGQAALAGSEALWPRLTRGVLT